MNSSLIFKEIEDKIDYVEYFQKEIEKISKQKLDLDNHEALINQKVDNLLYQTEYSFLLNELIFETKFIVKHFEDVPEKIKGFYEGLKNSMYSRKFVLVEEGIKELEDGYLETKRKEYLNSPQFKQLQQMLQDSSQ